ncbi:hypothetical protein C8J56DRAFT_1105386 [Mycena floridula]|nr:hypothetical protein C8J56DRAFT_1105386 [Mycena floridula]
MLCTNLSVCVFLALMNFLVRLWSSSRGMGNRSVKFPVYFIGNIYTSEARPGAISTIFLHGLDHSHPYFCTSSTMSAECTPDIQLYLRHTGEFIMTAGLPMITSTVFWTLYLVSVIVTVNVLWRRGFSRARTALLMMMTMMFVIDTVVFALGLLGFFYQTREILLRGRFDRDVPFSMHTPVMTRIAFMQNSLPLFILVPGDLIVIWRAYAVWMRSKIFIIIPVSFLIGRLVNLSFYMFCNIRHSDGLSHPFGPTACFTTIASGWILSFLANISATLMIFYTAWHYYLSQKTLRSSGVLQPQFSPVQRIMQVLVESGLAYFFVMIFSMTISLWPTSAYSPGVVVIRTLASITTHCIGMVPTLTILLVITSGIPDKRDSFNRLVEFSDVKNQAVTDGWKSNLSDRAEQIQHK